MTFDVHRWPVDDGHEVFAPVELTVGLAEAAQFPRSCRAARVLAWLMPASVIAVRARSCSVLHH